MDGKPVERDTLILGGDAPEKSHVTPARAPSVDEGGTPVEGSKL